jgi:hypothetical protein
VCLVCVCVCEGQGGRVCMLVVGYGEGGALEGSEIELSYFKTITQLFTCIWLGI